MLPTQGHSLKVTALWLDLLVDQKTNRWDDSLFQKEATLMVIPKLKFCHFDQ